MMMEAPDYGYFNDTVIWPGTEQPPDDQEQGLSRQLKVAIACLLSCTSTVGFFGNGFIIYIFLKTPKKPILLSTLLVISLSTADCLMCLITPLTVVSAFAGDWQFGSTGCTLYAMGMSLFGLSAIGTMSAIAMDRYLTINNLVSRMLFPATPRLRALLFLTSIWIYAFLWTLPPLLGWGRYELDPAGISCTLTFKSELWRDHSYTLSLFVCAFLLPLTTVIVCYLLLLVTLFRHRSELRQLGLEVAAGNSASQTRGVDSMQQREIRVAKVSVAIVIAYLLAWLPFAVVTLMAIFGARDKLTPLVEVLPSIFAKMSPLYNPFIYSVGHPMMKRWTRRNVDKYRRVDSKAPTTGYNLITVPRTSNKSSSER